MCIGRVVLWQILIFQIITISYYNRIDDFLLGAEQLPFNFLANVYLFCVALYYQYFQFRLFFSQVQYDFPPETHEGEEVRKAAHSNLS